MLMNRVALFRDLLAQTREGYSLPQAFYTSSEVFGADIDRIVSRKWLVAGHVSQVANKGGEDICQGMWSP